MDKNNNNSKPTRRDFIYTLTATLGVLGAGASVWPIVSQMNPGLFCESFVYSRS